WQLLQQLVLNAGRVMLHEELLARTWGPEYRDDTQFLRVWISRLRQKRGEDGASERGHFEPPTYAPLQENTDLWSPAFGQSRPRTARSPSQRRARPGGSRRCPLL